MNDGSIIQIKAHAKINLWLNVMYKRPDNFHEVEMLMQSISLADNITLQKIPENTIKIESKIEGLAPNQNIAYKAAKLFEQEYLLPYKKNINISIKIEKNIPIAAGLAGGSTDAAGVLKGLNILYNTSLTNEQLEDLARKLGSDVSFCLHGGTQIAIGRGEILEEIQDLPRFHIILAKPQESLSTGEIYKNFKNEYRLPKHGLKNLLKAISRNDFSNMYEIMQNNLENVSIPKLPIISKLKEAISEYGGDFAMMSGSGPTVFGIASSKEKAENIAQSLRENDLFKNCTIIETSTIARYE